MTETKTVCCYCGTGCGVIVESDGGRVTGVRGDPDHPANFGRLCTKGAALHLTTGHGGRALYPEVRRHGETARLRAGWDETLNYVAERFAAIIGEHGPDSVAFYVSGQLLTEDYYVFNKLAKGLIGTNNIDSNSRLCMSSAVSGYKAALGADAPPCSYADIERARCILIAGSNTAYAHPILFHRIEAARAADPELKLIVVDPRRTDTAAGADLHLAILPGTDVALFNGMLHVLLWEGLCDMAYVRAHTVGFDALKAAVREYTPGVAAGICGVAEQDIVRAAHWFGGSSATLSLYCQGLNQSSQGTDKNAALINLHLATGQIGRPGAGPFSLTGQSNAMGGREVGGMANLLSGHRDLANPEHRAEVARLWGVDGVPEKPGKTAVEMFQALRDGSIKAVWIACTNPAQSLPNQTLVRQALEAAELVVLQEAFRNTETAAYADVLLPAATWPEKDGTLTNSERRIARVRAAVPPPGEARPDWEIVVGFAQRLELLLREGQVSPFAQEKSMFPYGSPEEIFDEHRQTTRGRDLDISGLSYALLGEKGPQQWPFPEGALEGTARLYGDGRFSTPDGRARFAATVYRPPAEKTDARFPLRLLTGRLRDQWHGMSRTGTVARLFNHAEEPLITMSPEDMERRGLRDGDLVRVRSRRGELVIGVQGSAEVRPGQVFLPMHWGSRFLAGAGVNGLTLEAFDPVSKQPELKHAAVSLEKAVLPRQMVVLRRGDVVRYMELVQPLLRRFGYATLSLAGRSQPLMVLRAASAEPFSTAAIAELDRLLEMDDDTRALTYSDARRGIFKRVVAADGLVVAARLTGEIAACNWLQEAMVEGLSVDGVRRGLLGQPAGTARRGRIVCSCFNVAEKEIGDAVAGGLDFDGVRERLKCGTQCGCCVPEIKRMIGYRRGMDARGA
jgi:assimilatory nitrate reductase catalytic subunit